MAELRGGTTIGGYTAFHSGLTNAYLSGTLTINDTLTVNRDWANLKLASITAGVDPELFMNSPGGSWSMRNDDSASNAFEWRWNNIYKARITTGGEIQTAGGVTAGGTITSSSGTTFTIPSGGTIYSGYNNAYIIKDFNNGHITLSAAGGSLFLGYNNTARINLSTNLYAGTGSNLIADTSGILYYQGVDINTKYLGISAKASDSDTLDGMQPATANTASTIVQRDGSGNFSAGTITASLSGNASTASSAAKWTTGRTISLTGDITGVSAAFDGGANLSFATTLPNIATAGTYKSVTVNAKGQVTAGTNPTTLSGYGITDAALETITISAGSGLTGGGDLTANRSLSVSFGGTGTATTVSHSDHNHDGAYANVTGDTFTGNVRMASSADTASQLSRVIYFDATDASAVKTTTNYIRVNSVNDLYYYKAGTAYKIFHTGNDGPGSGLDADTVDGYSMNQNVQTTSSPTFAGITSSGTIIVDKANTHIQLQEAAVNKWHIESVGGLFNIVETGVATRLQLLSTAAKYNGKEMYTKGAQITWGTAAPSGGVDGNIYIQY